ncbi:MAG: methionyl-tRNA formyltransferase [Actinomycetota bacterium]
MPAPLRAVFLGNDIWSVPTLERLGRTGGVDMVLVVTNPPRPAGRGSKLTTTPVADAAGRLSLPLEEIATTRGGTFLERLRSLAPDVSVVVAYGELLSSDVLSAPRLGSVNLHLSLLPRWRGASPVQHAILAGDPVTGVTVIRMDEGLDTGPVLARREEPIRSDDDAGALGARLARIGAEVVAEVLSDLAEGRVNPRPQTGPATFAPKFGPGDRVVDWRQPADVLVRRVRAFAPDPGANTRFRGGDLKLLRAEEAGPSRAAPGTVVQVDRDGVIVAAGSGAVRLLEVAASGRRRMPAPDWARGVRDLVGERFGT